MWIRRLPNETTEAVATTVGSEKKKGIRLEPSHGYICLSFRFSLRFLLTMRFVTVPWFSKFVKNVSFLVIFTVKTITGGDHYLTLLKFLFSFTFNSRGFPEKGYVISSFNFGFWEKQLSHLTSHQACTAMAANGCRTAAGSVVVRTFDKSCDIDPTRSIHVTGFQTTTTPEDLIIHFQRKKNGGGDIESIAVGKRGTAVITFEKHEGEIGYYVSGKLVLML